MSSSARLRRPSRSVTCSAGSRAYGFGPRALGNRSILPNPRRDVVKDIVNARIKHRDPFPVQFAPPILTELGRVIAADAESEPAKIAESVGCGVVVAPGNPEALTAVTRPRARRRLRPRAHGRGRA